MATKRDGAKNEGRDDRRHLVYVGLLVLTVAVIIGVGAVLNIPDRAREPDAFGAIDRDDEAGIGEVEPIDTLSRRESSPSTDPDLVPLDDDELDEVERIRATLPASELTVVERMEADLERIEGRAGRYTLQFANVCDAANVTSLLEGLGGDERMFIVPTYVSGRPCYRICWGDYASLEAARSARDVPAELDALVSSRYPRAIDEVLP